MPNYHEDGRTRGTLLIVIFFLTLNYLDDVATVIIAIIRFLLIFEVSVIFNYPKLFLLHLYVAVHTIKLGSRSGVIEWTNIHDFLMNYRNDSLSDIF